jgi:quercetin dioxygenase-like cupin family protein
MRPALLALLLPLAVAQADQWVGTANGGRIVTREIDRLLAEHRLGEKDNIKAVPVAESVHVKQLLVQVRDREPLHYHADSDLTVFLLRGKGEIEIDGERRPVAAGDVIHIPRRAVHAYINRGPEVGVALVDMSPPPGPRDRVLVPAPAGR